VLTFDPAPVPEPGTFGLLAIGFGFLVRRARRG
jgi:PEP-CTERM motif